MIIPVTMSKNIMINNAKIKFKVFTSFPKNNPRKANPKDVICSKYFVNSFTFYSKK
jgi:hypothetical protein